MKPGLARRLATGTNALLVSVLAVAVTALLVDLAEAHRARWDLSADAVATLRPETKAALDALSRQEATVRITAFSAQQKGAEAWHRDRVVRDLLRELELHAPRLATRFVDYDADRRTAEAMGVRQYGTIVVERGADRVDLAERDLFKRRPGKGAGSDFHGEALLARAITQVLSDEERVVYVLAGHGERRLEQGGPLGLVELARLLDRQGWHAKPLDLLRDAAGSVPADAAAVLVVGPTAPLTPEEQAALRAFLGTGGGVGFFAEPGGFVPGFLEEAGVIVPSGLVMDPVAVFPFADRPLLRYRRHAVTDALVDAGVATLVAGAAPLAVHEPEGARPAPLLETSRQGWIERGTERPARYDAEVDGEGPVVAAVAVELAPPHRLAGGRLLVVGDADAISDELVAEGPGNASFAVGAVRWLLRDDARAGLVARPGDVRRVAMTAEQLGRVRLVVLGVVPLLTVLAGAAVRWLRRAE